MLSRSIQVGTSRRLVVAPPGFHFPPGNPTDIIVPQAVPSAVPVQRHSGWIYGLGRLKPGVPVERADQELAALSAQFEREFPGENQGVRYSATSLGDGLGGDTRRALLLLLASVAFVLLIACANVGNLLLERSLARQPEMAMRLALGAGRGRPVAQTLTEGLVLALAGGLAGVLVAWRAAPAGGSAGPRSGGPEPVGARVLSGGVAGRRGGVERRRVFRAGAGGRPRGARGQRRTTMSGGARRAAS